MTETYYLFSWFYDADRLNDRYSNGGWQTKKFYSLDQVKEELNNFLNDGYLPEELKIQQITQTIVTLNIQLGNKK